jgi:formylglycine-generating enzyme required for sulfatase activity
LLLLGFAIFMIGNSSSDSMANDNNLLLENINAIPEVVQKLENNMIQVEGGTFTMGCTSEQGSDCNDDENPAHQVTVSSFRMGKYEVTQAEWEAVVGSNPSNFQNCPDCPVENVSWNDVLVFIQILNNATGSNYRLPTEAEWEFAARGGNRSSGKKYSGSNDINGAGWYEGNSGSRTHRVGQKQANELGLYDINGNVWEWCSDWYSSDYYSNSPGNNPRGPSAGANRVLRGGCWYYNAGRCRVSGRDGYAPGDRGGIIGFRLVSPSK